MVECSPNPGDTDCDSSSVSAAGPSPSKVQNMWVSQAVQSTSRDKPQLSSHTSSQQRRASAPLASEEEGSHTHTSTLKPRSASGATLRPAASQHMERASSLEDPVVLSLWVRHTGRSTQSHWDANARFKITLYIYTHTVQRKRTTLNSFIHLYFLLRLRQNLREKHSRHVADLKAYYESEIQTLRDKLKLRDLPQDLEKSNQALTKRWGLLYIYVLKFELMGLKL